MVSLVSAHLVGGQQPSVVQQVVQRVVRVVNVGYPSVHRQGVGQGGTGGPAGGQVVIVVGVVQISRVIQVKDNGRQRSDLSPIKSQNNFEVPSFH